MTFSERRRLAIALDELSKKAWEKREQSYAAKDKLQAVRLRRESDALDKEWEELEQHLHLLDGKVFAIDSKTLRIRRVKPGELNPLPL
ncbi:MAG: hypothetical protein DKT66_20125 [Candidatus Melainabacteria bacterium]|nr:MAG: hypothetical protein DKT66_20125 [Candidatus Melainabacteria bacterium]